MIDYYLLTKPRIIFGNLVTLAAGFFLASKGAFPLVLFLATLIGLSMVIASACVFNNYIDIEMDRKMERTQKRSLVTGVISGRNALVFATVLAVSGNLVLLYFTNTLTVAVANVGFIVYVCIYSFIKSKTSYSTLIGSISGAIPPVVGYCAVSNKLDLAAALLFIMMVLWQMPHFYAIALMHLKDYKKAGIPVLPVSAGVYRTKVQMLLYIIGLIPVVALLTITGFTGFIFLVVSTCLGLLWLAYCIKGFRVENDAKWGKEMLRLSLVVINAICVLIPLDSVG